MPTHFNFNDDDDYVCSVLDEESRNSVETWQSVRYDYQFSFHTQHEAGWPCYLKEPDGPNRNLPKMNLKGDAYQGVVLQGISVVDNHCGSDFKRVIVANVEAFRSLAERYYEGEDEDEEIEVHRPPVLVVSFKCGRGHQAHRGREQRIKLPPDGQSIATIFWANFKRYAVVPNCTQHRNSDCMTGEVIPINDLDADALGKIFDRNGEIQDA
jgi:hypothetical protein